MDTGDNITTGNAGERTWIVPWSLGANIARMIHEEARLASRCPR